jgi:hypothetical protein
MSFVQSPDEYKTVFVLDNDECIGTWSLASGIHSAFSSYIPEHTGMDEKTCLRILKECMVKHYLSNGASRPGTKDTLKLLKYYKDKGLVDKVVMFTSAGNHNDWVIFLKDCIEEYCGVDGLYDMVLHRDNSNSEVATDGATVKCLDMVKKRLGFIDKKTKFVFIDDRPQNIRGDGIRVKVSQYRHVVEKEYIQDTLDEAIDKLQEIYTRVKGKKTYAPRLLREIIKTEVFLLRKKDEKRNIRHKYPLNQSYDTNLIVKCSNTFICNIKPTKLYRSSSFTIPVVTSLKRTVSL